MVWSLTFPYPKVVQKKLPINHFHKIFLKKKLYTKVHLWVFFILKRTRFWEEYLLISFIGVSWRDEWSLSFTYPKLINKLCQLTFFIKFIWRKKLYSKAQLCVFFILERTRFWEEYLLIFVIVVSWRDGVKPVISIS